jgi:hypothetical protein
MRRRRQRAAAQGTVDMALCLPLVVLLLVVLIQGAVYVHALHVAATAAQEGARAAAADGASLADGEAYTRALLGAGLGRAGRDLAVQVDADSDSVWVDVRGSMGVLGLRPDGAGSLVDLPLHGRGRASREGFRPTHAVGTTGGT